MKRRLFNLAAGVSLLLAVGIVALWVRSYWRGEAIVRAVYSSAGTSSWWIESMNGTLVFVKIQDSPLSVRLESRYHYYELPDSTDPRPRHWFPFPPLRFFHRPVASGVYRELFAIAYWLLLPPTLVLPAIALISARRRRRRLSSNLCPNCGYDLRATPDRCPECGSLATGDGTARYDVPA